MNQILIFFLIVGFAMPSHAMDEYRRKRDEFLAAHNIVASHEDSKEVLFKFEEAMASGRVDASIETVKLGLMLSATNFAMSYLPTTEISNYLIPNSGPNYYLAAFIAAGGFVGLACTAYHANRARQRRKQLGEIHEIKKNLVDKG
jgi:hypothetical protein